MHNILLRVLIALPLVAFGLFTAPSMAQITADTAAPATPQPRPIAPGLKSPRAAMETFLDAMAAAQAGDSTRLDVAISTLDLADINPLVRSEKGRDLVWTLQEVLDRTRIPNTAKFSTRTSGEPYVFQTYSAGNVALVFQENAGWRFGAETIAALPAILEELVQRDEAAGVAQQAVTHLPLHLRIRKHIPAALKQQWLVLEHWQWLGILAIIVFGTIVDKLLAVLLRLKVSYWRRRVAKGSFRDISDSILRPFGLMAMAFVWWAGLNMLGLPAHALVVLLVSVKFLACVATVWGAYRLVDLLGAFLLDRALRTDSKLDDVLVPLVTKSVKVFVTVMGVVFVADNLDVDVTSLLAGLGLGGLAFALAAKDVVGNLFGSVTVLLDQTFRVGDWVVIDDVEGTVERIGFRSTRIRTFYNSLVSVPNSTLITSSVDNMGDRVYRRLSCKLSLAYDTPPERIEAFCEGVRELVRLHPYMRKDYFHVYFNEFGASALDVLVYVFWRTPDWGTELRERHRFLLDCLRLAKRVGVEYAYPTQTVHLKRAEATPPTPEEGAFAPLISEDNALALGREQAAGIVAATTGVGVIPPPVDFAGDGDEGE